MRRSATPRRSKATIIASKGTLDWAYPPLILATTAAASRLETHVFFTFYGLNIIHKDFERKLKVSPVGNPAMPMPVPMPNLVTVLPGMGPMATSMMKSMFRGKNVATIGELLESARELDVHLIACQMTMDVFGYFAGRLRRRRRVRRRGRVPLRGAPRPRDPLRLRRPPMGEMAIRKTTSSTRAGCSARCPSSRPRRR